MVGEKEEDGGRGGGCEGWEEEEGEGGREEGQCRR